MSCIMIWVIIKNLMMFMLDFRGIHVVQHVRIDKVEVRIIDLATSLEKLGRKSRTNRFFEVIVKI